MRVKVKGINLLPKEYVQAEQAKSIRIIVGAVLLLEVCLFIGAVAIPPKSKISYLEKEVDYVIEQTKADEFKDVNKTIEELEIAKKGVQEWVDKYGNIKEENFVSVRALDSVTSRVPSGVSISTISINPQRGGEVKGTISIGVKSDSLDTFYSYMNVLESLYGRGNVEVSVGKDASTGKCSGDLTINIPADVEEIIESQVEDGQANKSNEGGDN